MAPLVMGLGVDPAAATPQFRPSAADEDEHPALGDPHRHDALGDPAQGSDHAHGGRHQRVRGGVDGHQRLPVHLPGADHHPRRARRGRRDRSGHHRRRPAHRPGHLRDGRRARARGQRAVHAPDAGLVTAHLRRPGRLLDRRARAGHQLGRSRRDRRRSGAHVHPARATPGRPTAHGAGLRRTPPAGPRPAGRRRKPERPDQVGEPHPTRRPADAARRLRRVRRQRTRLLAGRRGGARRAQRLRERQPAALARPGQRADQGGDEATATSDPDGSDPSPEDGDSQEESSEGPSPSPEPRTGPGSPDAATRERTRSVLETFLSSTRKDPVLAVGYADPDVAALARLRPSLLRRSDDLAARRMVAWGLNGRPVVAPRNGYFDPDLLTEIPRDSLMLLTDRGRLQTPVLSNLPSGQQLLMSDERAVTGGPAPIRCPGPARVAPAGPVGGRTGGDQGRRGTPTGGARHPGHLEPRAALARGRLLRRPGDLVAADRTPAREQHDPDVRRTSSSTGPSSGPRSSAARTSTRPAP